MGLVLVVAILARLDFNLAPSVLLDGVGKRDSGASGSGSTAHNADSTHERLSGERTRRSAHQ